MKLIRLITLICFLFFINHFVTGQRPKVGLTLSGGGAKGLAHIGILKAIDRAGLKVDYITGTSMGSIIGAMYAAGYSGEQIEQITGGLDWSVILSGKPSYEAVSLDEKDEYDNYSIQVPFNGLKPALSTGLIESEEIWLKFSEIFFPVHNIKDFSKFNIPFKCIATDLETGNAIVLDNGEIVWATRSSMAIPSVFSAVPYQNTKLVDGGIVRNFPVKDVKEMGADYVIGVNLFPGLSKADELNTMLDVMYQITNYRDAEDLQKEKKMCNVLIEPPLADYSAGSFGEAEAIIKIGNDLGEKYYPFFKHLADSLNAIEKVDFDPNNRLPKAESVVIDGFNIEGRQNTSESMLLQNLNLRRGEAYTPEMLNEGFRRAYSTLYYQYLYYEIIPTTPGHCNLKVVVKESAMNQLKIGFSYHSFTNGALIANWTMRNLLFDKARTYFKMAIGENWRFRVVHRQAFGKKLNNFIEAGFSGDHIGVPIYDKNQIDYMVTSNFYRLNLEYYKLLNHNWGFSIGVGREWSYLTPNDTIAGMIHKEYSKNFLGVGAYHNSLNRRFLPTSGNQITFKAGMFGNRQYKIDDISGNTINTKNNELQYRINFSGDLHQNSNDRLSFFETVDFGYVINSTDYIVEQFAMGGTQKLMPMHTPLLGIREAQVFSKSLAIAGVGLQYKFLGELYTLLKANIATYNFDQPFQSDGWSDSHFMSGFGAGVAYNLSALPMSLTMMYSPEFDDVYSHINIGFVF